MVLHLKLTYFYGYLINQEFVKFFYKKFLKYK